MSKSNRKPYPSRMDTVAPWAIGGLLTFAILATVTAVMIGLSA